MRHSLLQEYCIYNTGFIEELNSLPERYRVDFLKKFSNEHNRTEFLSKVSEFHFVQFFLEKGVHVDYEPKLFNKTPDLRIIVNGKEVIGDVRRFNLSEEDQVKENFFYKLVEQLSTIKLPYYVCIKQQQSFSFELNDVEEIKNEFARWINENNIRAGDTFNFNDLLKIEITNLKGIKDYILCSIYTLENKVNNNKISSVIREKVSYYSDCIIEKGYPFFVCVDLVFDTMIHPDDFKLKYQGGSCLDLDTEVESYLLGEFHTNKLYSNLLGILLRYNGGYFWIRNFTQEDLFYFLNDNSIV